MATVTAEWALRQDTIQGMEFRRAVEAAMVGAANPVDEKLCVRPLEHKPTERTRIRGSSDDTTVAL